MAKDKLIGVDLGGTTIKFAILTDQGEIQQKWSIKTNILDDGAHIVPDIVESINHHLDLYQLDKERIIGIGMGTPGTVNRETGTVTGAFNLNWKTEQPVKADIDPNNPTGAIATSEFYQQTVRFAEENQVGAGGEVGHMIVEPDGYLCTCGNRGCLEQYASATGVVHLAQNIAEEYVGSSKLKKMIDNGEEVTSKIVFDLAKQGDFLANKVVDKVAYYLGYATATMSNILNPSAVVIGGGVAAAGEFLRARVEEHWTKFAFPTVRHSTRVKLAELGNDAGVIGAASLARITA